MGYVRNVEIVQSYYVGDDGKEIRVEDMELQHLLNAFKKSLREEPVAPEGDVQYVQWAQTVAVLEAEIKERINK